MLLDKHTANPFLDDPREENFFLLQSPHEIADEAVDILASSWKGGLPIIRLKRLSQSSALIPGPYNGEIF